MEKHISAQCVEASTTKGCLVKSHKGTLKTHLSFLFNESHSKGKGKYASGANRGSFGARGRSLDRSQRSHSKYDDHAKDSKAKRERSRS